MLVEERPDVRLPEPHGVVPDVDLVLRPGDISNMTLKQRAKKAIKTKDFGSSIKLCNRSLSLIINQPARMMAPLMTPL